MTRLFRLFLIIGAAAAATACAESSSIEKERRAVDAQNTMPQNYKPDLLAFLRTYLNNPDGVRSAAISEPRKLWVVDLERYASCLRYNAKDNTGRYAGPRDNLAVFVSGKFDRVIELGSANPSLKPLRDFCATADYQPFPEMEKLHR